MPLPKAPTKRAARLETSAFEITPAVSKPGTQRLTPPAKVASKTLANKTSAATAPVKTAAPASLKPGAAAQAATDNSPAAQTTFAPAPAPAPVARKPVEVSAAAQKPKARKKNAHAGDKPKLFVLDTNVLMHDPMSLFRFEEHDVYLPMITLEELDGHKKGMTEVARNVRQVSRELDALAGGLQGSGMPLAISAMLLPCRPPARASSSRLT